MRVVLDQGDPNEDHKFARKLLRSQWMNKARMDQLMDPDSMESHQELMAILRRIPAKVTAIWNERAREKQQKREHTYAVADKQLITRFENYFSRTMKPTIVEHRPTVRYVPTVSPRIQYTKLPKPEQPIKIDIFTALHTRLFSCMKDFTRFQSELLRNPDPQLPSTFDGWVFFSTDPNQFFRLLTDICRSKTYWESAEIAEVIRTQIIPMLEQDHLYLTKAPHIVTIAWGRNLTMRNMYDIYAALWEWGAQLLSAILAKVDSMRLHERTDGNQDVGTTTPTTFPIYTAQIDGVTDMNISPPTLSVPPVDTVHVYRAGKRVDRQETTYVPTSPKVRAIVSRLNEYFRGQGIQFSASPTDFWCNAFGTPYLIENMDPQRRLVIQEVLERWKAEEELLVGEQKRLNGQKLVGFSSQFTPSKEDSVLNWVFFL